VNVYSIQIYLITEVEDRNGHLASVVVSGYIILRFMNCGLSFLEYRLYLFHKLCYSL